VSAKGPAAPPATAPLPTPETILRLDQSAYGFSLHLEDETTFVLGPEALYRVPIDASTVAISKEPLPLGTSVATFGGDLYYARNGALRTVPLQGGPPRELASVPSETAALLVGEAGTVWLRKTDDGGHVLEKLGKKGPIALHSAPERILSPVLVDDWVFFVETRGPSGYRLAGVSVSKGELVQDEPRMGRVPSMLAASGGYLYYYDGPQRAVRRLSASFEEDVLLGKGTICSPLAASDRILCAQVGGIVELDLPSGTPRKLTEERNGPITAMASTGGRVTWITDMGKHGLGVHTLPLPPG